MALRESTSSADERTSYEKQQHYTHSTDFLLEVKSSQAADRCNSIIIPLPGDITSQDGLKAMAARVRSEVGFINLLICNSGMSGPTLEALKPRYTLSDFVNHAWSPSMEDFNATYNLNCTAVYYTVLAFLELLDEGNNKKNYLKSQVIATASTVSYLRIPRAGYAYTSSKTAVISLIKSLSTFCVPWGIRFNAIAAGCKMHFPSLSSLLFFQNLH
jgi:NAD(P)-dependent dehydrogenase (short-subunit alcohol dehydrogenase family)